MCFLLHTHPPFGPGNSEGFFPSSCGRILSLPEFQFQDLSPLAFPAGSSEKESVVLEPALRDFFLDGHWRSNPRPRLKTFKFSGVAGGTIERSCYSPHYVNTERDYERDYQATLPQGRTAADGCKPRHGRDDRKRERSSSWLSPSPMMIWLSIIAMPASTRPSAFLRLKRPHPCVREGSSAATRGEVAFHEGNIEYNRG